MTLKTKSQKALVIKIDGLDGCGKTTLINETEKTLRTELEVLTSAEFGSEFDISLDSDGNTVSLSKFLKSIALDPIYNFDDVERELFWAVISRRHNRKILPELETRADVVLVDRSNFGNYAYGNVLDKRIFEVFDSYTTPISRQDWVFWLDTPVDICQERLNESRADSVEGKGRMFFQKVHEQYRELCDSTVNASRIDGALTLKEQVEIVRAKIRTLRNAQL